MGSLVIYFIVVVHMGMGSMSIVATAKLLDAIRLQIFDEDPCEDIIFPISIPILEGICFNYDTPLVVNKEICVQTLVETHFAQSRC